MSVCVCEGVCERALYLRGLSGRGGIGVSLQRHSGVAGLQLNYHTVCICCVFVCACVRERKGEAVIGKQRVGEQMTDQFMGCIA